MTLKYTRDHEWLEASGNVATVGITQHAQEALGDVAGVVESVKAAADVFMPVDGEIVEVNEDLSQEPSMVNTDPLGDGWLFRVKLSNPAQLDALMDETTYTAFAKDA